MIRTFLKIATRRLIRDKTFSLINIFGLAIGFSICAVTGEHIFREFSYDDLHENKDRIYRVTTNTYRGSEILVSNSQTFNAAGAALKNDVPGVGDFSRVYKPDWRTIAKVENDMMECKPLWVDPSFLKIFSFKLKSGSVEHLTKPTSILVTESFAAKLFGSEEVIGRGITFNTWGSQIFVIDGVIKEPGLSHIKFDVLMPLAYAIKEWQWPMTWDYREFYTYVLLQEGVDPLQMEGPLASMMRKYRGEDNDRLELQPIKSIHLSKPKLYEPEPGTDQSDLLVLMIFSTIILTISWVNYVNFSIAKSLQKAREIGLKRLLGATKSGLKSQFIFEAFFYHLIALSLALTIMNFFKPLLQELLGYPVEFWSSPFCWTILILLVVSGSVMTGLISSASIFTFRVMENIKGRVMNIGKGLWFRRVLVTFQFMGTLSLIIGAVVIYGQVSYMKRQDLGVDMENVVVVHAPDIDVNDSSHMALRKLFKNQLLENPNIAKVSVSNAIPGSGGKDLYVRTGEVTIDDKTEGSEYEYYMYGIDEDYLTTMSHRIIAGENFRRGDKAWESGVIINEQARKSLGFNSPQDAINQTIRWSKTRRLKIRGVIKDYHHHSLKEPIQPMVLRLTQPFFYSYFNIRALSSDWNTIEHIKQSWEKVFPGRMFSYFFLDEEFDQQYKSEQKFSQLIGIFSFLAILIATFGLLGLTALVTAQRTKQVGIRKVLGASLGQLMTFLGSEFLMLYLIACIITAPVIYLFSTSWLDRFPYRTDLHLWYIMLPIVGLLMVIVLTVFSQTFKTANANPVEALRQE